MILTSSALGIISAVGIACGVVLNTTQDIYVYGKLFNDHIDEIDKVDPGYAQRVESLFEIDARLEGDRVKIGNELLGVLQNFINTTFPTNLETPPVVNVPGFPYYRYISMEEFEILGYYFKERYGNVDSGTYIEVGGLSGMSGKHGLSIAAYTNNAVTNLITATYQMTLLAAVGWDLLEFDNGKFIHVILWLTDGTTLRSGDGIPIENIGVFDTAYELPYVPGSVDWGNAFPDVNTGEYEGDVGIYVPGNLEDVGTITPEDVLTGNPDIDWTTDGTVDVPENITDIPLDIDTDIPITTVPSDEITEVPVIPPIDIPDIPDIGDDLPEGEDGNLGEDELDDWGNSRSGGLYYYYIGDDTGDSGNDDVIGHATGVVSLSYTPYLWCNDCNITKLPYDSERFGKPSTFSNFYVYRINEVTKPIKKVGGFTAYSTSFNVNTGEGKPYNYMNETKLYQYPYSFAYVYDGINQPLEIKYHYLSYVYNDIYIKQTVSDKCTYGIFVKDYKGDREGNLEGIVLTSGNELPCSSSTYAQWFATNRNQMSQNIQNVLSTNAIQSHGAKQQFEIQKDMSTLNVIGGLGTALAGLFTMNIGGVGTGLMSALNTNNMLKSQQASLNTQLALNKQSDQNAIQSAMALNNDMRNAPPTLVSHGSNVFYGILNTNKQMLLLRMGLSEEDYFRIGTYFTMYGYKQNKLMEINLRSRKYFNYFKITAPNIVSTNVPHSQLEKIKEIFKEGITLWHYNNSTKVLDYFHSDNYEV